MLGSSTYKKQAEGEGLFFGVGTGRCGTMSLANTLNSFPKTLCLHEGMVRNGTEKGEAVLEFLTLQNKAAYSKPDESHSIFAKFRGNLPDLKQQRGVKFLGDIAYNYAPFVKAIATQYPRAKLIFLYRNGIDFVRSVITDETPDPCPVGWQEKGRNFSREERYIALGRLRPIATNSIAPMWEQMTAIAKNAWLWSETNRLILDAIEDIPQDQVFRLEFASFFADVDVTIQKLSCFLGMEAEQTKLVIPHINRRSEKIIPHWKKWDMKDQRDFRFHAGEIMERLGYDL